MKNILLAALWVPALLNAQTTTEHPRYRGQTWLCFDKYITRLPIRNEDTSGKRDKLDKWEANLTPKLMFTWLNNERNNEYITAAKVLRGSKSNPFTDRNWVSWTEKSPSRVFIFNIKDQGMLTEEGTEAFVNGMASVTEDQILNSNKFGFRSTEYVVQIFTSGLETNIGNEYYRFASADGTKQFIRDRVGAIHEVQPNIADLHYSIRVSKPRVFNKNIFNATIYSCKDDKLITKRLNIYRAKSTNSIGETTENIFAELEFRDFVLEEFKGD